MWDEETVLNSVKKTGRLIIVDKPVLQLTLVSDKAFDYLDGPVKCVYYQILCSIYETSFHSSLSDVNKVLRK